MPLPRTEVEAAFAFEPEKPLEVRRFEGTREDGHAKQTDRFYASMIGDLLTLASALALATLFGCASSNPPLEAPLVTAEPDPPSDEPTRAGSAASPDMPIGTEPVSPQSSRSNSNSVPDNYVIMSGDCVLLGKQLAAVTRSDELVKLSPKLTEQQRSQAEKSIDDGSRKLGDQFADGCQKSSAGNTGDPKSLKCALNAATVKAFSDCLNAAALPN